MGNTGFVNVGLSTSNTNVTPTNNQHTVYAIGGSNAGLAYLNYVVQITTGTPAYYIIMKSVTAGANLQIGGTLQAKCNFIRIA
jgi:hypothetical protein